MRQLRAISHDRTRPRSLRGLDETDQGQSTVEYVILVAALIAALIAMQIYLKGGVQGKLRDATDQIGDQFSPAAYRGKFQTTQTSGVEETTHVGLQQSGQSKSDSGIAVGGVTGTTQTRTGQDVGGGVVEKATDAQSNDRLF